jgi:ABC-type branched-subunit amino acid transport system ATPase component
LAVFHSSRREIIPYLSVLANLKLGMSAEEKIPAKSLDEIF